MEVQSLDREEVVNGPSFLVFDLPSAVHSEYQGRVTSVARRVLVPVLAVYSEEGDTVIPDEALGWSMSLAEKGIAATEIRRKLSSVGRLFEFTQETVGDRIGQPGVIDVATWQYLGARIETPLDPSLRKFPHWKPVRYETVRTEFRDLVEFARFCADRTGSTSKIGSAFKSSSEVWLKVERRLSVDDLLSHLEAQRARWHALIGGDEPALPASLKRKGNASSTSGSDNDTTLSTEEIEAVIDRERNFMFRALWILLAYVGPRASEALNLWRCDVLDTQDAKRLFRAKIGGPVVIFADPRYSTYTGSLDPGNSVQTRNDYLERRFGLKPRPDIAGKRQRAGWKGMAVFNPRFLVTHGSWTCRKKSAEFADCFAELLEFHQNVPTEGLHPYLFVNAKNAEHYGEPLKIKNVQTAFKRACARAGIDPDSPGANLHGQRHYYRWYAKNILGLDEETIQLMLRHRHPHSQYAYGKHAADLNDVMSDFRKVGPDHEA